MNGSLLTLVAINR